jgi:hypothetical protein
MFEANLRLLHDVLERSPLRGRYWVLGGMLLGWAREGRILSHDSADADFGFLSRDALEQAIPGLFAAGFRPLYKWIANSGEPVEWSLQKDSAKFEFFLHVPIDSLLECRFFGWQHGARHEYASRVPAQELVPFEFLQRTWLKPADHDLYLTTVYGDWRTPRPEHDYTRDDRSIVSSERYFGSWEWNE